MPFAAFKRFAAGFAVAGLIAAAVPAHAEIEKFMRNCDMKLCVVYRASIAVPEGWAEHEEASRELGVQMMLPKGAEKGDWEVELGIVIGSKAQYVGVPDALKHVAGYCIVNDVSERNYQLERGGNWSKGKSADTFCPMGPWLVTADEVPDPQALDVFCEVSGQRMQNGSTKNMIFSCAQIVSYISHFLTLTPGDVILLMSWRDHTTAEAFEGGISLRDGARLRRVRVVRDYGMFDRREAPQYYPDAQGAKTLHA